MDTGELAIDHFGRVRRLLAMSLDGLSVEQLMRQPDAQSNPLGWIAWHLTRIQDHAISGLAERDQAWIADGWAERFGMEANPDDTGTGHSMEQVTGFRSPAPDELIAYYDAVYARSQEYLRTITREMLDRVLNEPRWDPLPTVGVRLVSVMHDNSVHAGEISYLKGLMERRRWFPA